MPSGDDNADWRSASEEGRAGPSRATPRKGRGRQATGMRRGTCGAEAETQPTKYHRRHRSGHMHVKKTGASALQRSTAKGAAGGQAQSRPLSTEKITPMTSNTIPLLHSHLLSKVVSILSHRIFSTPARGDAASVVVMA